MQSRHGPCCRRRRSPTTSRARAKARPSRARSHTTRSGASRSPIGAKYTAFLWSDLRVGRVEQQRRHEDHSRTGRLADVLIGRHEITNKRGGKVTQVIVNMLPPDGKRIDNTYKNYSEKGELTTTTAVYERMP